MTPTALAFDFQAPADRSALDRGERRSHRMQHGGELLDDVLSGAWSALTGHSTVTCPVCRGSMVPRYGSGAAPVGGRCRRCGSTLG
jgi:hypothetical protein